MHDVHWYGSDTTNLANIWDTQQGACDRLSPITSSLRPSFDRHLAVRSEQTSRSAALPRRPFCTLCLYPIPRPTTCVMPAMSHQAPTLQQTSYHARPCYSKHNTRSKISLFLVTNSRSRSALAPVAHYQRLAVRLRRFNEARPGIIIDGDIGNHVGSRDPGDRAVFRLVDKGGRGFDFDLRGEVDHPAGNNDGGAEILRLDLTDAFSVTDSDGDPSRLQRIRLWSSWKRRTGMMTLARTCMDRTSIGQMGIGRMCMSRMSPGSMM